jgi:hypothetical protein
VTEGWRNLHSEQLQLHSTQNMIMVTKSNKIRWLRHGIRTEEVKHLQKILSGKTIWKSYAQMGEQY